MYMYVTTTVKCARRSRDANVREHFQLLSKMPAVTLLLGVLSGAAHAVAIGGSPENAVNAAFAAFKAEHNRV